MKYAKKYRNQEGFTAVELSICVAGITALGLAVFAGYVVVHFIAKFW